MVNQPTILNRLRYLVLPGATGRPLLVQRPTADQSAYSEGKIYMNPVLPGDHPDPTMLRVGDDFYHCGSRVHFTPCLPSCHATNRVHGEVISRGVPPTASFVTGRPS